VKKAGAYPVYLFFVAANACLLAMIFTVNMVYQVIVVKLTPLQLVLVGTGLELTIFLCEVPTGVVADVYSRRLSIIIGMFIMGAGFLLEGSVPYFWAILAGQALWGLGYTFTSGATQAWISDELGTAAAGPAFLRGSQADQLGALVGIPLGVALSVQHVNVPILVGGAAFLVLGVCLVLIMPETGFRPAPMEQRSTWQKFSATLRSGLNLVRMQPALLTILGVGFFYGLYSEGYDRLWTKHLLETFTFPLLGRLPLTAWFGLLNLVGLLLSAAAVELMRRRLDIRRPASVVHTILAITAALALSIVIFAQTRLLAVVLAAYWLIYILRNVASPLYTTWINQRLESQTRATLLSFSSQVDAIGQIAGGPFVGLLGNLWAARTAITVSGLLLTPALALCARAEPTNKPDALEQSYDE
jgi:DHA3 family tetracycline resistance protein-like MFS transporter